MTDALFVVPGPDDRAVVEEARRLSEELANETPGAADVTDRHAGDADEGTEPDGQPRVVAVAFDGLTEPDALPAGDADEIVRVARADGDGFVAGAAGVRPRADALADVAGDARAVLLPDTADGVDLAAATARRLRAGCVSRCLLRVRDGELLAGRPAYGGRAYAEISFDRDPPVVTLDAEALGTPAESPDGEPSVRTVEVTVEGEAGIRHVEAFEVPESDLAKARRIVAGGRGLGDPGGFEVIEDLADALGAAVGASRPPADDGWVPYDRQIGVTGKEIDVDLYAPCAISGDSYHMRSVNADCLIAINSDPEARIFEFADLGVVGDVYEHGPALAAAIREAVGAETTTETDEPAADGDEADRDEPAADSDEADREESAADGDEADRDEPAADGEVAE